MAIQVFYHASLGQLELRGSASPVKQVMLMMDGETFAIYDEETISTPLIGKKREGTTDVFAALPLSDALAANSIECVLMNEEGEHALPVEVSDLTRQVALTQDPGFIAEAAKDPSFERQLNWHLHLKSVLQELPFDSDQSAERLNLLKIDWDALKYALGNEEYTRLLFRLILNRECKDEDIKHYNSLARTGTSAVDLARRATNGIEAKRLDLSHLSNTPALNALLKQVLTIHAAREEMDA